MGLFGSSSKQSGSSASGFSQSGLGAFAPVNEISFSKPLLDITKPFEVVAFLGLVTVGVLAWRKFKRGA